MDPWCPLTSAKHGWMWGPLGTLCHTVCQMKCVSGTPSGASQQFPAVTWNARLEKVPKGPFHPIQHWGGRGRKISEFKTSQGYKVRPFLKERKKSPREPALPSSSTSAHGFGIHKPLALSAMYPQLDWIKLASSDWTAIVSKLKSRGFYVYGLFCLYRISYLLESVTVRVF